MEKGDNIVKCSHTLTTERCAKNQLSFCLHVPKPLRPYSQNIILSVCKHAAHPLSTIARSHNITLLTCAPTRAFILAEYHILSLQTWSLPLPTVSMYHFMPLLTCTQTPAATLAQCHIISLRTWPPPLWTIARSHNINLLTCAWTLASIFAEYHNLSLHTCSPPLWTIARSHNITAKMSTTPLPPYSQNIIYSQFANLLPNLVDDRKIS